MGPGELPKSWLAEGSAIRQALVADFAAVPGVWVVEPVDARCLDLAGPTPPNVTRIIADPARPVDLDRLALRANSVVLVAPETGRMLETLTRRLAALGVVVLGSTPEAVALCGDKFRLAGHLEQLGIPTPPTRTYRLGSGHPAIESPSGRVVVKPVDGAGAVDSFVLDLATLNFGLLREVSSVQSLLIQPYRPGIAMSASFLVGQDGRSDLIAVGRQRISLGPRGEIQYDGGEVPVTPGDLDLGPVRAAVESVEGLRGFVGVDCIAIEPTGRVEVIEINPRVTTSIVGLTRLARPGTIARAWLDRLGMVADNTALADLAAIRSAPPVRFRADGTILPDQEPGR